MAYFTLTTEFSVGDWKEYLVYTIEAEDRQMVKYHFHYTLKGWGFADTQLDKHCLENWDQGIFKEIYEIREIDKHEFDILDDHMYSWHKTAEQ